MFLLTIKHYYRHFEGDERYEIIQERCYDHQLGNWLARPKTWDYELLNYRHID